MSAGTRNNLPEMPNAPILELNGQRKRFHIPFKLKPLLEDMAKEILRHGPDNIYEFLADYLEKRVAKENESTDDKLKNLDSLEKVDVEQLKSKDPSPEYEPKHKPGAEFQTAAVSTSPMPLSDEGGSMKLLGWSSKAKFGKPPTKISKKFVLDSSESASEEVRTTTTTDNEKSPATLEDSFALSPSDFDPAEHKQATVIQSAFRGHMARKKVKDMKATEPLKPLKVETETEYEGDDDHTTTTEVVTTDMEQVATKSKSVYPGSTKKSLPTGKKSSAVPKKSVKATSESSRAADDEETSDVERKISVKSLPPDETESHFEVEE